MAVRKKKPYRISPRKAAKLDLMEITFKSQGSGYIICRDNYTTGRPELLRHILPATLGSDQYFTGIVYSKTMKHAVSKALQSMDEKRFYWK